jgi:hypothetical protein
MKRFFLRLCSVLFVCFCALGSLWVANTAFFDGDGPLTQQQSLEGWIRYPAANGKFAAQFPKEPNLATKEFSARGKRFEICEYTTEPHGNLTYSVSHVDLPRSWTFFGSKKLLGAALKIIAENDGQAEIISSEFGAHGKRTALDFHMRRGTEEIKGRLILVGTMLYRIAVVAPADHPFDEQKTQFVTSFEAN